MSAGPQPLPAGAEPPVAEEAPLRLPPARVTQALIAANVALFALEVLSGGSESALTLRRMGAVLGRDALAREPWRVLSAAFLHIGPVHLAVNMWALWVFGRTLELVLGRARFLVLYLVSAAGGGLLSSLTSGDRLAAGASGAVWGLMTAEIALFVRSFGLLPPDALQRAGWTVFQPLLVNLAISFMPGIDLAGHLGGGLAGAAAWLSGALVPPRPRRREPAWAAAALLAGSLLAASVTAALATGRPWELRLPGAWTERVVGQSPVRLRLPSSLRLADSGRSDGAERAVFGVPGRDPLFVEIRAIPQLEALAESRRKELLAELLQELSRQAPGDGFTRSSSPRVVETPGGPAVHDGQTDARGLRIDTWVLAGSRWLVRLDVARHPHLTRPWREAAGEIVGTLALGP